ncbi:site-specific recombinase XerD [Paraburkholderia sp. BL27I4N3]|uniref:site-specific integrase n=1 Tax=Paraburkholderia sp. BL27I4N3 TaxID=1938805 RepID=UPI000E3AF43E|nr:site-specific integrase [Paraburkholderia sp. BL27I4N3]REE07582.1 site-specific recombinase XerD [Paraburkholderia sp. BL27I4N3]
MIRQVVSEVVACNRARYGALEPVVGAFEEYLVRRGYAGITVENYLQCASHFGRWLTSQRIALDHIDEAALHRFLTVHLPVCHCCKPSPRTLANLRRALRNLLRMLRAEGIIPPRSVPVSRFVHDELQLFDAYLKDVQGLAPATRLYRLRYVREFLLARFGWEPIALERIKPDDIYRFVTDRAEGCQPRTAGIIGDCLRSYLRFRRIQGDPTEPLISAVPRVAYWRLAALPDSLTDSELAVLVKSFDRTRPTGRRDYAIVRCLVDLGLRASEVASIQLDDLDWREGTLRIAKAKAKRTTLLPLPVETGRAISDYLRFGRPSTASRALFVRHRAPRDEPVGPSLVRNAVRCAYARCGHAERWTGTHVLRHSVASRLLREGASLKDIADLLRHRSVNTTTIYLKVDLPRLNAVALPWPGRRT